MKKNNLKIVIPIMLIVIISASTFGIITYLRIENQQKLWNPLFINVSGSIIEDSDPYIETFGKNTTIINQQWPSVDGSLSVDALFVEGSLPIGWKATDIPAEFQLNPANYTWKPEFNNHIEIGVFQIHINNSVYYYFVYASGLANPSPTSQLFNPRSAGFLPLNGISVSVPLSINNNSYNIPIYRNITNFLQLDLPHQFQDMVLENVEFNYSASNPMEIVGYVYIGFYNSPESNLEDLDLASEIYAKRVECFNLTFIKDDGLMVEGVLYSEYLHLKGILYDIPYQVNWQTLFRSNTNSLKKEFYNKKE